MAYPDFISNAPNYAEQFLRINQNQNTVNNDAVSNWMKQIQAAKVQQDMARQPDLDAQQAAKTQSELDNTASQIDARDAGVDLQQQELPGKLTSQKLDQTLKDIAVQRNQQELDDKDASNEFANDVLQNYSPADFADPSKANELMTKHVDNFSSPTAMYNAYGQFAAANPAYGAEVSAAKERTTFSPGALDTYNSLLKDGDGDRDQAMSAARLQNQADAAQAKADADKADAKAKQEGKNDADTGSSGLDKNSAAAAKVIVTSTLANKLDPRVSKLTPGQRAAITADVYNSAKEYSQPDGSVDADKLSAAIDKRLNGSTPTAFKSDPGYNSLFH